MNARGQMNFITVLFGFVMGLVVLVALLPVTNSLVSQIQQTNMQALSLSSTILLLAGMSGIFMFILFLSGVFNEALGGGQPRGL